MLNKILILLVTVFVSLGGVVNLAHADDKNTTENIAVNRIAVLDIDQILLKCDAAVDIRDKLESKREEYQKQISKKEGELRDKVKELTKQKSTLSEDEFNKKRVEFEKSVVEAQRGVQERIKKLEKSYDDAMAKLREEVVKIVAEYSTQQKLGMVLARSQVVLVDSELDITKVIMTKVNKNVKKVSVNLPK